MAPMAPRESWKEEPDDRDRKISYVPAGYPNAGKGLSAVLLVRGQLASEIPLTVADGYHRICASYHLDEDADIPCRIIDLAARQIQPRRR
jgi:hypothetical protein